MFLVSVSISKRTLERPWLYKKKETKCACRINCYWLLYLLIDINQDFYVNYKVSYRL